MTAPELESLVATLQKEIVVHHQIKAAMEQALENCMLLAIGKIPEGRKINTGDAVAMVRALRIEHDKMLIKYHRLSPAAKKRFDSTASDELIDAIE